MAVIPESDMIRYLNGEGILIRRGWRTYRLQPRYGLSPRVERRIFYCDWIRYCVSCGGPALDELLAMYSALKFGSLRYFHANANFF